MSQALFSAVSGAGSYEKRLDILANNLSNINTAGFKQDKLIFRVPRAEGEETKTAGEHDFLYSPPPMPAGTTIDFSQGDLKHTQNPLDLALDGKGFFCIQTPEGKQYTRKGSFALSQDGVLVTKEGHTVQGKSGKIKIAGQDVRIDEKGNISVDGARVDTIEVVSIEDLHNLRKIGDTMFAPPAAGVTELKAEDAMVKQGFIEISNVNPVKAMTEMIDVMRGYESYQKVILFLDDVTRKSITDVGKL
ncbi:MAG: flagellar basal-body rod protein FlgF [Deltaproteobacteria bacterium]|nr:flagellar basal-body rod protein FlgF [Deltaproteobacteria bacterium]